MVGEAEEAVEEDLERADWARKAARKLKKKGRLVGILLVEVVGGGWGFWRKVAGVCLGRGGGGGLSRVSSVQVSVVRGCE